MLSPALPCPAKSWSPGEHGPESARLAANMIQMSDGAEPSPPPCWQLGFLGDCKRKRKIEQREAQIPAQLKP